MSSKVIVGIVAAVVVIGGAVAYFATQGNDDSNNSTTQTNTEQTSDNNTEQQPATTQYSISQLASAGRAQKCTFTYSGPNGQSNAVMYTNGTGMSRIDMDSSTEEGNAGTMTQIVRDGKSYTVVTTDGQKMGFVFDVTQTQGSNSSSSQGVDPDASFTMNCGDWNADTAQFELPTDVQFISPTVPAQ